MRRRIREHCCRREDRRRSARAPSATPQALSCRECGHQVELGPFYACPECFGPLEIAYDFPRVTREEIEAGPRNIWRYKALLPVPTDIEQSPNTEPGFTRLLKAHNLGRELGIDNLWVKDDSTNPTNSFKDRVVACALSAARELGAKVFACPSTGNLANAVAAAGARAGIKTVVFIPSNLEQPKQVNSAVFTEQLVAVERQLRRRQQARLRDRRRGGGLGVRQRQRPALLRRGLQDAGLRDRRAARLAAARPDRDPGRLRLAADQGAQGVPGAGQARPGRGQALQGLRRAGRPAARRSRWPTRPASTRSARSSRTPSPRAWPSATRPTASTSSTSAARPAAPSRTSPTTRSATAIVLLARTEGIFTETAGGTTVGVLKKLVETGQLDPALETVVINTGHGLKTLDAVVRRRRPGRDHRADVRRVRRDRPRLNPHHEESRVTATVRIPTILRTYTEGESEVTADGATLAEVLDDLDAQLRGHQGPDPRRPRRAAPLRQRLRRQRRRAVPRQPRDPDPRRHPDLGDPGGRRRLTPGGRRAVAGRSGRSG